MQCAAWLSIYSLLSSAHVQNRSSQHAGGGLRASLGIKWSSPGEALIVIATFLKWGKPFALQRFTREGKSTGFIATL
jgi:hypothetical protein